MRPNVVLIELLEKSLEQGEVVGLDLQVSVDLRHYLFGFVLVEFHPALEELDMAISLIKVLH